MWKQIYNIEYFNKLQIMQKYSMQQVVNISGWIREHQEEKIILEEEKFTSLMSISNISLFEKANKILLFLSKKYPIPGITFYLKYHNVNSLLSDIENGKFKKEINSKDEAFLKQYGKHILPIIAMGRILNYHEFAFIWSSYLRNEKKFIHENNNNITPKGWAHIETLKQSNPNSKKVFVAMWFDDEMKEICDKFIFPAIKKVGFYPVRIDNKEHNNDINDEIIGEIRSSRFVVADFTGNRGGVYYEAGFANGLNIEVIHMCKKDELENVHFDVNHRNIIDWKTGEELYQRLTNRIKATII